MTVTSDAGSSETPERQPLAPAVRRRLQKCFEHGSRSATKGDFDYATDMFSVCVRDDPGNPIYIKQFLDNLGKKYKDNKKGAGFTSKPKAAAHKGSIKKAQYSKDWDSVRKAAIEMLKINPWDISTLVAMAEACDSLNLDEAGSRASLSEAGARRKSKGRRSKPRLRARAGPVGTLRSGDRVLAPGRTGEAG